MKFMGCGSEHDIYNLVDKKAVGLLGPLTENQQAKLQNEPVFDVRFEHPEMEVFRCAQGPQYLRCVGEMMPLTEERKLPFKERRLSVWNRTRTKSDEPLLAQMDKLCDTEIASELRIAAHNRLHPDKLQAQITDIRKRTCGGPDGPEE